MSLFLSIRRATLASALILGGSWAQAQDVALVISNAATLKGTVADTVEAGHSRLVSLYRDMGYEVMEGQDLNRQAMRRMLSAFSRSVEDGDGKIVVHFSGRAVTIGNETLLVPVGLDAKERTGVIFEAVPLTAVLSTALAREGDSAIILALNTEEDPDFESFATRPFKVDAPENALVVYGGAGLVNRAVRNEFLTLGLSAAEVEGRNSDITLKGKVTRNMRLVPSGRDRDTGLRFADDALWQLASSSNDRVLIDAYIARFPNGRHVAEARSLLGDPNEQGEQAIGLTDDARRTIQRHLTILGYDTRGIDGIFGPGTRGSLRRWQRTRDLESSGYLKQPQIAMLRGDAEKRTEEIKAAEWKRKQADTAFWQRTGKNNTKPGLVRYLERYPNGVHSKQAKRLLNQIRSREDASARQEDRAAWQRARDVNTPAGYRRYLQNNPEGTFRDRAEENLVELGNVEQRQAQRATFLAQENELGLSRASVRTLERRLAQLEYETGPVDGEITGETRRSIRRFQSSQEIEVTGFFNQRTVRRLLVVSDNDG